MSKIGLENDQMPREMVACEIHLFHGGFRSLNKNSKYRANWDVFIYALRTILAIALDKKHPDVTMPQNVEFAS